VLWLRPDSFRDVGNYSDVDSSDKDTQDNLDSETEFKLKYESHRPTCGTYFAHRDFYYNLRRSPNYYLVHTYRQLKILEDPAGRN